MNPLLICLNVLTLFVNLLLFYRLLRYVRELEALNKQLRQRIEGEDQCEMKTSS